VNIKDWWMKMKMGLGENLCHETKFALPLNKCKCLNHLIVQGLSSTWICNSWSTHRKSWCLQFWGFGAWNYEWKKKHWSQLATPRYLSFGHCKPIIPFPWTLIVIKFNSYYSYWYIKSHHYFSLVGFLSLGHEYNQIVSINHILGYEKDKIN